jgi:integrase
VATLFEEPRRSGRWAVQYHDGKLRPKIRLGKVSRDKAAAFKARIEDLVAARRTGHTPSTVTLEWLKGLDDAMLDRLAELGLVAVQRSVSLGEWLDRYIADREGDLKPASVVKLRQTRDKLLAHFSRDSDLRALTTEEAANWWTWLRSCGLTEAAAKIHAGNAKTIMNEASRRGLIAENPFCYLKSGPTASKDAAYVSLDDMKKILDACPMFEARLAFALARLAGFRFDSETKRLALEDIDWEKNKIRIQAVKTEGHEGCGVRYVPVVPRLMKVLYEAVDRLEPGQRLLFTKGSRSTLNRQVEKAIAKTGVAPWKKLWQTLRSSCEVDWEPLFGGAIAARLMGHAQAVSRRHYTQVVPDEVYARAAKLPQDPERHPEQKVPADAGKIEREKKVENSAADANSGIDRDLQESSATSCPSRTWRRGDSNP